eukprot:CAMPEP_0176432892 /NCGR_PEP_ID=MMETSP0127-20121128/15663_1 /TAXON_ID=938130 /ORGANISM="Platyophrya macrostoma, Strain WH" /LENGTH=180 /DNA_ID=CAMNT_0017815147 /DNA_START=111 /DNA_END=653 /DNA_ORIENTATION=+
MEAPSINVIPIVASVAPGYAYASNPFMYAVPVQPVTLWSSGICGFLDDVDSAVDSLFCARCQLSRQYNMITYGNNSIEPWTLFGPLIVDILIGMPVGATMFAWYLRNKVRARYQIAGDDFNDCMMSVFLPWCSISQVYREMSLRGEWPSGMCIKRPYTLLPPPQAEMGELVQVQAPTEHV